jgi:hypothetical protein
MASTSAPRCGWQPIPAPTEVPWPFEFIFPLKLLSAYADFDTTGQQLIEAGFVHINGERVSLNLAAAKAGSTPR